MDLIKQLHSSKDFFERSTRVLEESDSQFCPQPGMMTVAQQVAHAAQTVDWFLEGASSPQGFDLDFAKHAEATSAVTSLAAARKWFDKAYANATRYIGSLSADDLARPLPPGPVMGGAPIGEIVWGIIDHTAHHRGALTGYSRALGKVPVMPYFG